jgi:hypothetical protein
MAKAKSKKVNSASRLDHVNILSGLFFVLAFAVVTTLSAYTTLAAKPQEVLKTPNLSLSPSSQNVAAGSTLAVQVWEDSGIQSANAVQANMSYPIDKLNFVGIDTTNSAFGVEAQSSGGNGVINIARGSTSPISGRQLVATVKFTCLSAASSSTAKHRASSSAATATVSFTDGTVLLSDVSNSNILAATYSGTYSL